MWWMVASMTVGCRTVTEPAPDPVVPAPKP